MDSVDNLLEFTIAGVGYVLLRYRLRSLIARTANTLLGTDFIRCIYAFHSLKGPQFANLVNQFKATDDLGVTCFSL